MVKNSPAMQEIQKTGVQSLGLEDPLEEEMATHSSIPALRIHGQRSLVGYSSWGLKSRTSLSTHALHSMDVGKEEDLQF